MGPPCVGVVKGRRTECISIRISIYASRESGSRHIFTVFTGGMLFGGKVLFEGKRKPSWGIDFKALSLLQKCE